MWPASRARSTPLTMHRDQGQLFDIPHDWWVGRRRCLVCGGNLAQTHTVHATQPVFTYVMQRQGWVKIGKSYQPEVRRKVLSMPSPGCRVVAPERMEWAEPIITILLIDGDVEHELHLRWAANHAGGEWFLPDQEMRLWLNKVAPSPSASSSP